MAGHLEGFDLGDSVLEIGPGFGATTRALVGRVPALTALEIDEASVSLLRTEFDGLAEIVLGSGADMPFEDNTLASALTDSRPQKRARRGEVFPRRTRKDLVVAATCGCDKMRWLG